MPMSRIGVLFGDGETAELGQGLWEPREPCGVRQHQAQSQR